MEEKVSQAMLEEPVKFWINTRGLLRLIGIKKIPFSIYPLHYGTMIKISGMLNKINTGEHNIKENPIGAGISIFGNNAKLISRIIAYAVTNSRTGNLLFARPLAWWFSYKLTGDIGQKLALLVVERTDIKAFLNTIVFLKGANVLAPKTETSPMNGTREIIARGDSKQQQSNTSGSQGSTSTGE